MCLLLLPAKIDLETADEGPINISFTFDQPPNTTFDQQSSKEVGAIGGAINQASTSTNAQSSSRKRKFPAAQETSIDNVSFTLFRIFARSTHQMRKRFKSN